MITVETQYVAHAQILKQDVVSVMLAMDRRVLNVHQDFYMINLVKIIAHQMSLFLRKCLRETWNLKSWTRQAVGKGQKGVIKVN